MDEQTQEAAARLGRALAEIQREDEQRARESSCQLDDEKLAELKRRLEKGGDA